MTLKERLSQHMDDIEEADHAKKTVELIREISGMFNPDHAVDLLALINQLTRLELGDLDIETFKKVWGL